MLQDRLAPLQRDRNRAGARGVERFDRRALAEDCSSAATSSRVVVSSTLMPTVSSSTRRRL
jgi:hypothetical protein